MTVTKERLPSGILPRAAAFEIRLFGEFEVRRHGLPLPRLRSRKEYRLLALLILRHDRPVERPWIAGTLWPDSSEGQALANLRNSLKAVRRAFGPEACRLFAPTPRTLALDLSGAAVDVMTFDDLVEAGDAASLKQAVALYRAPLLEGWTEEWLFEERQLREGVYLTALEALAQISREQAELAETDRYLRLAIAADPLRETAHRALMATLAQSGRYAAAVEIYRDLRLLLHRELNSEPSLETVKLYECIRSEARSRMEGSTGNVPVRSAFPQIAASKPGGPEIRAAQNRIPRPLTRLIGREAEAAATRAALVDARLVTLTGAGGVGKTRLAIQVAETVSHEYRDGAWFVDLAPLADPALVDQTVGGVLGIRQEAACRLVESLAAFLEKRELLLILDNCEHVVQACAQLAARLLRDCPHLQILATSRQPLDLVGECCRRVPSLGDEDAVRLFGERAGAAAPGFVETDSSRETEARICRRLDGIPLAIELAAAWVRAVPVETIEQRMDDRFRLLAGGSRTALPRHQTLRATIDWSYNLLTGPEQALLRRLSVFAGGWTLEAAEAVVVLQGLEASGEGSGVDSSGSDLTPANVLHLLTALVDKSLVVYPAGEDVNRYRLLETVRQYARDRLLDSEEAACVWRRHLDWAVALAELAETGLLGIEQASWLERLELEHDNLRAALDGALENGHVTAALRLCGSVWRFWDCRHAVEGRERLATVLAHPQARERTRARANSLGGLGTLLLSLFPHDVATARGHFQEMLAIGRELRDPPIMALALNGMGHADRFHDHSESAQSLFEEGLAVARAAGSQWEIALSLHCLGCHEEALAIWRELGDRASMAGALGGMAGRARQRGDYEQARALLTEALATARDRSRAEGLGLLFFLGDVARVQGDFAAARAYFEEFRSIAPRPQRQIEWTVDDGLHGLGEVARDQGDLEAARSLLEACVASWRGIGMIPSWIALRSLGDVARYQGDAEAACSCYREALALLQDSRGNGDVLTIERDWRETPWKKRVLAGLFLKLALVAYRQGNGEQTAGLCREGTSLYREVGDLGGKLETAQCLETVGTLSSARGQFQRAARLIAAAVALREAIGAPLPPVERLEVERSLVSARAALGEEAYTAARTEGQAMTPEQAISDALQTADC